MRVMGVDFGGTRIGLAVMDARFGIASARPALLASGTLALDADEIAKWMGKEECELAVLGLPLAAGEETKMSRIVRMLGDRLAERGVKTDYEDEALTSFESEREMEAAGLKASQRRKMVDGEAAIRILERWHARQGGAVHG